MGIGPAVAAHPLSGSRIGKMVDQPPGKKAGCSGVTETIDLNGRGSISARFLFQAGILPGHN